MSESQATARAAGSFSPNPTSTDVGADALRDVGTGDDNSAKPAPAASDSIPIEPLVIRQLRTSQIALDRFIRSYLVFVDVHRRCLDAREFCEQSPGEEGYLRRLRRMAWEDVRDEYNKRPLADLDSALLQQISDSLEALRTTMTDSTAVHSATDQGKLELAERVGGHLTAVSDAVAELLGSCRRLALEALQELNSSVGVIFNRTEEARRAGEASYRAAFEGTRSDWAPDPRVDLSASVADNTKDR